MFECVAHTPTSECRPYPNPIGMNFEETFKSEESSESRVHVVQSLGKDFGLLVVLQKQQQTGHWLLHYFLWFPY